MAMVLIALLCVAVADFYTGSEIRLTPFYFIPIAISATNLGRRESLLTALASTVLWTLSNYAAGLRYSSDWILVWNATIQGAVFLFVAQLVANLHTSKARERELARVDSLTGLLNARAFYEQAPRLLEYCQRAGQPVVMAYIDLDNFKSANDSLGHQHGDELLRIVAGVMKTELRSSDLLARMGGDEFVAMLPNSRAVTAREALERMRDAIASRMIAEKSGVTVSIGAVSYSNGSASLNGMLNAADELLYAVKQAGKNRVICRESEK